MPTISVIVPVFNVEKYLHRCIDSILGQNFSDLELLLINDGSTDSSGKICDEYAQIDSRVRVFHKENGGVSSARNFGLDNAIGKWITFVDSDDYVDINFCDILLDNENEDLIVGSFAVFDKLNDKSRLTNSFYSKNELSLNIDKCLLQVHFTTPWGKLFKKEILDIYKLRFPINIDSTEDTLFIYEYLLYVDTIRTKSEIIYYYRHTGSGLSFQNLSIEKTIHTINVLCCVIDSLEKTYNTNLSYVLHHTINYLYVRSIRFINKHSFNIFQRFKLINILHSHLPHSFLKEYIPPTIGVRGKLFYMLARNDNHFLLSLYSYCVSI